MLAAVASEARSSCSLYGRSACGRPCRTQPRTHASATTRAARAEARSASSSGSSSTTPPPPLPPLAASGEASAEPRGSPSRRQAARTERSRPAAAAPMRAAGCGWPGGGGDAACIARARSAPTSSRTCRAPAVTAAVVESRERVASASCGPRQRSSASSGATKRNAVACDSDVSFAAAALSSPARSVAASHERRRGSLDADAKRRKDCTVPTLSTGHARSAAPKPPLASSSCSCRSSSRGQLPAARSTPPRSSKPTASESRLAPAAESERAVGSSSGRMGGP
mmetsp:Transcript_38322/g.120301  ORF Transcript_38322/g.120301 Transcript_38322/m.120301 type:complete len:282 (-) Transcript_38322:139-984(-)